jgi:dimethylglycine dehydrogenase
MDFREMDLGMVPALVGRVSFTGDLGFEIWIKPEYQLTLYEQLIEAGRPFEIVHFGGRALNAMRLEKNFGSWATEFRPIYGPFAAGLGRFIALAKEEFIGRAAAASEKRNGSERVRVGLVVDAADADVIGNEPVWHDGKVVGWVTSGGYAHNSEVSMAQAYVPAQLGENSEAELEVEIIGERRPARPQIEPIFDPGAERMRM